MKATAALVLCCLLGGALSSYAQTQPAPLLETKAWDVGLQVSYLTYNEHLVKTK